jgi:hypothetical protein
MGPSFWTSSLDEVEAREACRKFLAWFSSVIPSTCFNSPLKNSAFDFLGGAALQGCGKRVAS